MNIENQVCTFSQAKRLKELGVNQNSYFTWMEAAEYDEMGSKIIKWHPCLFYEKHLDYECCYQPDIEGLTNDEEFVETRGSFAAFTVAELGMMLPECISGVVKNGTAYATPDEYNGYDLDSVDVPQEQQIVPWYCDAKTEAQARAQLLTWLIENKLIEVEKVNEKINS